MQYLCNNISMITKNELDKLVEKYENEDFIKDDPVQFIHKFKTKKDTELAGFIASLLAYGSRQQFIKKLNQLFEIAQNEPLNFIQNFEPELIGDFNSDGLEELFEHGYKQGKIFENVVDYFYNSSANNLKLTPGQGFYHMIPDPHNGGAMKRMCMYLRWMVRKSPVDVGIWEFMKPSELYIPLDVHVGRISREMGLLTRKANDFKAVIELTENLKKLCPEDPIKYDFALFAYGVNNK